MTEREAIAELAMCVAAIAQGCWEALGTDLAGDIASRAFAISAAMAEEGQQ